MLFACALLVPSTFSLTISPRLMGLLTVFSMSFLGAVSAATRMELLHNNHTRSLESTLKFKDIRHILIFPNDTPLACDTTLSQHL